MLNGVKYLAGGPPPHPPQADSLALRMTFCSGFVIHYTSGSTFLY